MIRYLGELRRRLTWLWRLAKSEPLLEFANGPVSVLWVFDTIAGPDGYSLRALIARLAIQQCATVWSFGPQGISYRALRRFIDLAPVTFCRDFEAQLRMSYLAEIAQIRSGLAPHFYLSGSFNGTFAATLRSHVSRDLLWELQHGFLDESYFPLHAATFFSRSEIAAAIINRRQSDVTVIPVSNDLAPPRGTRHLFAPGSATEVHCFSKNPGGGCTKVEVCTLEAIAARLARSLSVPLRLYLHPRDNILKLIARHRSTALVGAVLRGWRPRKAEAALVVSSFSTALATRPWSGDMLVNVRFSPTFDVRAAQYAWLPTVPASDVADASSLTVLERTT